MGLVFVPPGRLVLLALVLAVLGARVGPFTEDVLRYGVLPLSLGCGRVLCVVIGSRQTGPLSHTVVILVPCDWAVPGRDWALECFVVAAFSRSLVWLFFRLPRLPSHFAGLRCPSPSRVVYRSVGRDKNFR